MESEVNKILNDLYAIDGGFRANEKDLRKLIVRLLEVKPDTKFDESFAARLRSELVSAPKYIRPVVSPFGSIFSYKVFYSVASAALTILIVVPITYTITKGSYLPGGLVPAWTEVKDLSSDYTPKQEISVKGTNAFGKLDLIAKSEPTPETNTKLMSVMTAQAPGTEIKFEYKGEDFKLTDSRGEVFKRSSIPTASPSPIDLAEIFIKGKAIDASLYGKPIELSANSIIYPLLIKGTEVYTDSGEPFGLDIGIDNGRVFAVNDPGIQKYESSDYALETDFALILELATKKRVLVESASTTAELGTPKKVLMKQDDLFVPALLFPVKYSKEVNGPKNIVIPIVKEFLSKVKTDDNVAGVGVSQ